MIYELNDVTQAATLIQTIQIDTTVNQCGINDFQWLIITLQEALNKKYKTDLRFDTPNGLDVHIGCFNDIQVDYTSLNASPTKIDFSFTNHETNSIETYSFTFPAQMVEENTHSRPGEFMKYYINDTNHKVLVGIIVSYK